MVRFDTRPTEILIAVDPSLHVSRVRIHGTDAKLKREAYIDGYGPVSVSAKDLPDGNYLVRVDCDTVAFNGWATISRK